MRTALLSLALCAALAAPAGADTWLAPRDGLTVETGAPVAFTAYLGDDAALPPGVDVLVARDDALTDVVARYAARPLPAFPAIFSVTAADLAPGTYRWQASYGDETSPVRALTIVPAPAPDPPSPPPAPPPYVAPPPASAAPAPPLDPATARAIVRRAIAAATHRLPRRLVYRCTSAPGAATCRPSWRDGRFRYRGTLTIAAGLHGIAASFSGTRSGRRVAWSATVA